MWCHVSPIIQLKMKKEEKERKKTLTVHYPKWLYNFAFLPAKCESSSCFTTSPIRGIPGLFIFVILMVSHCDLISIFLMTNEVEHLFTC